MLWLNAAMLFVTALWRVVGTVANLRRFFASRHAARQTARVQKVEAEAPVTRQEMEGLLKKDRL